MKNIITFEQFINETNESLIIQPKSVIGNPFKMGKLEIAENDFPEELDMMTAAKSCEDLGNGWRLPTKDELTLVSKEDTVEKYDIWREKYWTSTEIGPYAAWMFDFNGSKAYKDNKYIKHKVRAVKG